MIQPKGGQLRYSMQSGHSWVQAARPTLLNRAEEGRTGCIRLKNVLTSGWRWRCAGVETVMARRVAGPSTMSYPALESPFLKLESTILHALPTVLLDRRGSLQWGEILQLPSIFTTISPSSTSSPAGDHPGLSRTDSISTSNGDWHVQHHQVEVFLRQCPQMPSPVRLLSRTRRMLAPHLASRPIYF